MERVAEPGRMTPRESTSPIAPTPALADSRAANVVEWDLARTGVRALNQWLHHDASREGARAIRVLNPDGQHHLAAGLNAPLQVEIAGHAGYFVAGMNQLADVVVQGNVG
jgi:hypothetical protein